MGDKEEPRKLVFRDTDIGGVITRSIVEEIDDNSDGERKFFYVEVEPPMNKDGEFGTCEKAAMLHRAFKSLGLKSKIVIREEAV